MTEYSAPRAAATTYTVYPTGYDQSPFSDTHRSFCIYVERYPDTGRWRVHDGFQICTHNGTWTNDRPQVRHLTRFDTLDDAMEIAFVAVDTRPGARNLVSVIESSRGREIAASKES